MSLLEVISRTSSVSRILWNAAGNKWKHLSSTEVQHISRLTCSPCKNSYFVDNIDGKLKPLLFQHSTSKSRILDRQLDNNLYALNTFYKPQIRIELPVSSVIENFKLPPVREIVVTNQEPTKSIEAPSQDNVAEKRAARLIVIRRRKMKKHKLKKLRIKMKYEWAKVRQRREMRKEKAFQAELIAQIKEAEKFDAKTYVLERLAKAKEVEPPRVIRRHTPMKPMSP